jgi:hypothetical protein
MDEILDKSEPDLVIELKEILDLDMFLKWKCLFVVI